MRKVLKKIHLYLALVLCLPLIIQGLSGTFLTFRNEISNILINQKYDFIDGEFASEEEIVTMAQAQVEEGLEAAPLKMPQEKNRAVKVYFKKNGERKPVVEVVMDPVSLTVIEVNDPAKNIFRLVKKFHEDLFIENGFGKNIVGIYGIVMLFMSLSGLILWWPKSGMIKRALTFKFSDKGKKFHRDLHGAVGFWTMIPLLASSITGIYLIYFRTKESNKLWHAIHDGSALGLYGQGLMFIVGFLPILFSVTGISLWWLKKQNKKL